MTDTISKPAKAKAEQLANEAAGADLALARVLQEHSDKAKRIFGKMGGLDGCTELRAELMPMILPDDEVEAAWDEAESECHPAPITLTYFMKALVAAGYEIRSKDEA